MLKICIALVVLVSYAACLWPGGQRVVDRNYRGFTVTHNEMENANNETRYAFSYKLANRPSYFFSQGVITAGMESPNITISGLRINEVIAFRVAAYKIGETITESLYSPYTNINVKPSELAGNTLVPGMPLNVEVLYNNDNSSTHSAIVNWEDPQNIQDSNNATDKDIQYRITKCRYNKFTKEQSKCVIMADILRNTSSTKQSTKNVKSTLYNFNFHPGTFDEWVFHVTGYALNGTAGQSAQVVKRLVPSNAPPAPYNLTTGFHPKYADQLTLSWLSEYDGISYVKYNIKGNSTTMLKSSGSSPLTITGLKKNTTYEFQVGVYNKDRGGSEYSLKYTTATTNEFAPTPKPDPNSGTMLTSSLFLTLASIFAFLKFL